MPSAVPRMIETTEIDGQPEPVQELVVVLQDDVELHGCASPKPGPLRRAGATVTVVSVQNTGSGGSGWSVHLRAIASRSPMTFM